LVDEDKRHLEGVTLGYSKQSESAWLTTKKPPGR
jgi:hypothetical protein